MRNDWLENKCADWRYIKLKYIGESITGLTYSPDDVCDEENGILVLRSSNLQSGIITYNDNVYVSPIIVPKNLYTKKNDILICSRNGSRELIGKNAIVKQESIGLTFGAFTTIFRSKFNRFIYYVFNSNIFKHYSGMFLTSTVNQLTLNTLNNMVIPLPPLSVQTRITEFLDGETARIDALIEKKKRLVALLEERKKAVITEAVTGSSLSYEGGGEMRNNWQTIKAKYLFKERLEKANLYDIQLTASQEYGVLSQKEYIKLSGNRVTAALSGTDNFKKVIQGDFVISLRTFEGGIEHAYESGCISPAYTILKPSQNIYANFFKYLFKSYYFISLLQTTITGIRDGKSVKYKDFSTLILFVPPFAVQERIASFLDGETARIDEIKNKILLSIKLLEEYRTALITEAVTGVLEV